LRGEGTAGPTGQQNRRQQYAEFAQKRIGDEFDREYFGAEVA